MTSKRKGHTPLHKHKKVKRRLLPPLHQLNETGKLNFSSWIDDRLPHYLWLAIIRSSLSQNEALRLFREVIDRFEYKDGTTPIPTHSLLASLSAADFDYYMEPAISDTNVCRKLGALLFLDELPDRHHWIRHIIINGDSLNVLAEAVFRCLNHQSQEATDIRWFAVMCMIRNKKIVFPDDPKFQQRIREYIEYPNLGDQRSVRPSIRALEMAFRQDPDAPIDRWCTAFWQFCWRKSGCIAGERQIAEKKKGVPRQMDSSRFMSRIEEIYDGLVGHFRDSRDDTKLDARHDASFGLPFYALYLAWECAITGAYQRAIGQIIVRTLAEIVLTLGFLRSKDDPKLWVQYRNFGMGQVKLSFLKLIDSTDVPEFVDLNFFEQLIEEDFWHEHLEITLGHWAGRDLRKLADEAGMKDIYDKYYSTTSPFVHGTWSAVRMTAFETCLNPLHRFHRVPTSPTYAFPSAAADIKKLLNILFDLLASLYPEFKQRLSDDDLPTTA